MRPMSMLSQKNLRGKTVLLRVDFNIASPRETFRLEAALPTIRHLVKHGAVVLLMSHRGRPVKKLKIKNSKPKITARDSLRITLPFLKKNLRCRVQFFNHHDFLKIAKTLAAAKPGSVFLMENLRLLPGEEKNSASLARTLASLGDIYVNDAFAVSHRAHASVHALPKLLPAYAGLRLMLEVKNLDRVMRIPRSPLVVILGGAKAADKVAVMAHLAKKTDTFLLGGVTANTFLKAAGLDIQKSIFDRSMLPEARKLLKSRKVTLPIDFTFHKEKILDIGPLSADMFALAIRDAGTVLWNGPMGLFEDIRFHHASETVARAVARTRAFTLVGGGESTTFIRELGLEKKIDFLSTGGGAMLHFLAGKSMPGLEALNQ